MARRQSDRRVLVDLWQNGCLRLSIQLPVVVAVSLLVGCGSDDEPIVASLDCQPGSSETTWATEGDSITVPISCLVDAELLAGDSFSFPDLPAGASYDSSTSTLNWTPGLDQAAVWNLEVVATSGDAEDHGTVVVGVADAFDDPSNVPVVDPLAYPSEFGLPVLFLQSPPTQSDADEPTTVIYGGRQIEATGQLRGASSLSYPKKSYLLKFEGNSQFYDIERKFVAKRRVVLTSTFDDNAYFRQRLTYELWNALEPTLPIQTYNAVVYLDGEYWGLYTVTDHLSKHWLEELGRDGEDNLYKAINHDANFRTTDANNDPKGSLGQGYEKKEGPDQAFTDIEELVAFASGSSDTDFRAQLGTHIDIADYSKWWALVTFTLATDSAGKNSYHHHQGEELWTVAPWDFNASFGQRWETTRLNADQLDDFGSRNEIFERMLADATLGPALRKVLRDAVSSGAFSTTSLDERLDAVIAEIDQGARRDQAKWGDEYIAHPRWAARTDFTDYDGELAYIREWLSTRRPLILERFAEP